MVLALINNGKQDDVRSFSPPPFEKAAVSGMPTVPELSLIHILIDEDEAIALIREEMEKIPALYIADGHHRAASAVKVGLKRREENPGYTGDEEFNFFLSVVFPYDQPVSYTHLDVYKRQAVISAPSGETARLVEEEEEKHHK